MLAVHGQWVARNPRTAMHLTIHLIPALPHATPEISGRWHRIFGFRIYSRSVW